jgi:regulator of ribonuclease activity A
MIAGIGVDQEWAGIVLHGCVRDVSALRELPIGLKALGSNPRPSSKRGEGQVDVPVRFGDVTFRPGAMLYSDEDGIVVLDAGV